MVLHRSLRICRSGPYVDRGWGLEIASRGAGMVRNEGSTTSLGQVRTVLVPTSYIPEILLTF